LEKGSWGMLSRNFGTRIAKVYHKRKVVRPRVYNVNILCSKSTFVMSNLDSNSRFSASMGTVESIVK